MTQDFADVGGASPLDLEGAKAQADAERTENERAQRRADDEKLIAKLQAFTEDNCPKEELEVVKRKLAEAEARIKANTPTSLTLWRGLADMLDEVVRELHRFLVMDDQAAKAVALWVVHSHVFMHRIFPRTPHMIVWSKTHGCAKTTLREILELFAANVEAADSVTGTAFAAFLQKLADIRNDPTLIAHYEAMGVYGVGLHTYLWDEAEQYKPTGFLMRLVNAAHQRSGVAWTHKGEKVPVFAPVALFRRHDPRYEAVLRPTVSRAVLVEMKQRDPDDPKQEREQFIDYNPNVRKLIRLRERISAMVWSQRDALKAWRPERNFLGGNRLANNWMPLCAIADVADKGTWGKVARQLARAQEFDPNDFETRYASEPDMDAIKRRMVSFLQGLATHRCSRTELSKVALQYNTKSSVLTAALAELEQEGAIKTDQQAPGSKGGRWTLMVELVQQPASAPTPAPTAPSAHVEPITPPPEPATAEPIAPGPAAATARPHHARKAKPRKARARHKPRKPAHKHKARRKPAHKH
jgi:hypothetical protein